MEHTLGDNRTSFRKRQTKGVLILVLMEHTLGVLFLKDTMNKVLKRLNPCFNGTYSRSLSSLFCIECNLLS